METEFNGINILMIARQTLNSSPGGDTVQINSTAHYLRKMGFKVDIALAKDSIDYTRYHLVHFFNIIRPDDILSHIVKTDLPFVISTIFVEYTEYEQQNRKGLLKLVTRVFNGDQLEYLKSLARVMLNGDKINSMRYFLSGQRQSVRYAAKHASMLLPNSVSEYTRFEKRYHVKNSFIKVPNAVDVSVFTDDIKPDLNYEDAILCVGRIEGRKNQLNLMKALIDTNLKLVIIGKPSPNHLKYYQECLDIASRHDNIKFVEHIDHQQLVSIYKAAKVHVLPSWFETTGLSSLEAAIMGCNIVVTPKGDTREYFGDWAYYCEPDDIASIREAVLKAHAAPVDPGLRNYILEHYTWEQAAIKTAEAYYQVLNIYK